MRIDLHADDLGATRGINTNILEAWHAGALDSVSIIANGNALHEAATEINSNVNQKLRLVVHLNLIHGTPIADPSKLSLLVGNHSQFRYRFTGLWILWQLSNQQSRMQFANQVEIEWREQIKRVIEVFSPRSFTAVDSHDHVHMLPFLFPIAAKLAREFDLPEIRISNEIYHFSIKESIHIGFAANIVKHILLNLLARPARRIAKNYKLASPDAIVGILYSGRITKKTVLSGLKAARRNKINWLEIVFHPGRAIPSEANYWSGMPTAAKFHMDPHRDIERNALISIGSKSDKCLYRSYPSDQKID